MSSSVRKTRVFIAMLLLAAWMSSCASAPDSLDSVRDLEPSPSLSAREVVQTQLFALGNNNDTDEGIEIAFRFASPGNRRQVGPLSRFAAMLRTPSYAVMLKHDRVEFAPLIVRDGRAVQRVALFSGSTVVVYDFYLRRQEISPYEDCWMTEGVAPAAVSRDEEPLIL